MAPVPPGGAAWIGPPAERQGQNDDEVQDLKSLLVHQLSMARATDLVPESNDDAFNAYVRDFIANVENGHGGMTAALVNAVRQCSDDRSTLSKGPCASRQAAPIDMHQLRVDLDREPSAAGRNRILRTWLARHKDEVVTFWGVLDFPLPPGTADGPSQSSPCGSSPNEKVSPAAAAAFAARSRTNLAKAMFNTDIVRRAFGVAIFDFDQTLTIRHVSIFEVIEDTQKLTDRIFGGDERLQMIRDLFEKLHSMNIAVTIVSRNARYMIFKVLNALQLASHITDRLVFGNEDYGDEVPKSTVIRERLLTALELPESLAIFIDDDSANIRDVRVHLPGMSLIPVRQRGMVEEDCRAVLAWAERVRGG
eukprot:gnl/TRDRNA2_/TRDRNA2_153935_c0_seq1.p1 gnl/TRDRNA2_/TRDRNA2_153935_c0~~gnl/TRDRNA2_/TRDRNA2_153935_c0_seq1.p1  ORF type:complete len:364 (-),score=66.33 gnl/TRDRNA2_/TRDRNA2_153935_c0_seq1:103-1194(-)